MDKARIPGAHAQRTAEAERGAEWPDRRPDCRGSGHATWALRDMLAHLAAWQGEALRWVEQAAHGEEIGPLINQSVDEWNAHRVAERKHLPIIEVIQEFNENHDHLLAALEKEPCRRSVPLGPGAWNESAHLWWLTEHDEEHLPMIADYRRRLAASAASATDHEQTVQ